jgi:predicted HTH domain antitoxin
MAIIISDEVLQAARISEDELLQEIAILLFQKEKLTLAQASRLAKKYRIAVSAFTCKSANSSSL